MMSLPDPTTSFRVSQEVKDALFLLCERQGKKKPGTWLAEMATEYVVLEMTLELLGTVGFSCAYQALETQFFQEDVSVSDELAMLPLHARGKAFYTEMEKAVLCARASALLKAVGFTEMGKRIRHGLLHSYQGRSVVERANNDGLRRTASHSVHTRQQL